jgi:hypothetical protein
LIEENPVEGPDHRTVTLPGFGEIDVEKYSLLGLAVLLGFGDGFNVCSLGALLFLLGLVFGLGSRKRIILVGGMFIFTVVAVYWVLILLWYKAFSVLSAYLGFMQVLVGVIALGGGIYYFRQFLKFKKSGPVCEFAGGGGIVSRLRAGIKETIQNPQSLLSLLVAIIVFAVVVTIIEFPCSAVIPAAFTGVLAVKELSTLSYLFYITVYTLFYMADEIVVFSIAVFTSKIWLASPKFVTWSTLANSVILSLLGIYYLFII